MFDKKHIDAYSSIKAPHELYEKVTNAKPEKSKVYLIPLIISMAACFILVFGVAAFSFKDFNPTITFDGTLVTSDSVVTGTINAEPTPASIYDMRSLATLSFPIQLTLDNKTEVAVSEGSIVLENGERTQSAKLEGDVQLLWEVNPASETCDSTMTLRSFGKTQQLILTRYPDGSYTAKIK